MSHTPREIGTLIIVIDKANHLPNKRHIGKQHPYCAVEFEGRKARTKTIKKGGQHPEWDEELRFPVYEDVEDELARTAGDEHAPSPPPKDGTPSKPSSLRGNKSRSKKSFKLACYADDAKEPDLIGETVVDLSTVLTKGEQDDWHTLMYKDKFAGKVYLELTFYSNEEPPPKKAKVNSEYVGPGNFTAEDAKSNGQPRNVSTSRFPREPRMSLRNPSGPTMDLYSSPYDRSSMAADFSQLALSHSMRRESFPPSNGQSHFDVGYQPPRHSASLPIDGYESDVTSTYSTLPPNGVPYHPYHAPYEPSPTPAFAKSSMRGPRYSVPASSSGFRALPTHPSEPSGFVSTLSHTPAPSGYRGATPAPYSSHFAPPLSYTPIPSQTPLPHSSSGILSYPPSQPYAYPPQHAPPPPPGASQHYAPQTPPHHHQQQNYAPYPNGSPSPPSEPSHPIPPSSSLSSSHGPGGSRPLPQPQQAPGPQFPPAIPGQPPYDYSNSHSSIMFPTAHGFQAVPPPPPPPPIQSNNSPPRSPHQHYDEPQQYQEYHNQYQESQQHQGGHLDVPQPGGLPPPPPPPPPISQFEPRHIQRRISLPQPPGQPLRGVLPIPPPPPLDFQHTGYPLPSHLQPYVPGPPPRPPQLDADGQWVPPPPPPQPYPTAGWA